MSRRVRMLVAASIVVSLLATVPAAVVVWRVAPPVAAAAARASHGVQVVGRNDLGARGMNAGLAIAGDCAYVGSRSDQATQVLDLADPAAPRVIGAIPAHPGSTPREARADAGRHLLVILNYRLGGGSAAPNTLDLYDIADCRAPVLRGQIDFGDDRPHEFFLWSDRAAGGTGRVLAYLAMWGHAPNLRVVDVTDPTAPATVATWDAAPSLGVPSRIHSLTVSDDGTRAFVADWDSGLLVLDTTSLAKGTGDPTPGLLTPPERWLQFAGARLHSAERVPGTNLVVTTQEIYGTGACPYGHVHVVDAGDPTAPRAIGEYGTAENDPARCDETEARDGAFTSHNPLVVGDLAFVSWYAGGLRAIDLRDPASPVEAGVFVPEPLPSVAEDDLSLGAYPVRLWSSPILRDGLIYVVDIRNGLFVLRYSGRGAKQVAAIQFAQGNAN